MEIPFKQFVIIPKNPKMSAGKIASQACHATYMALKQEGRILKDNWEKSGMCVITLQCKDSLQLIGIAEYFKQWKIKYWLYIDEGITEVEMGTPTALATGILTEDQFWMVSQLKLYKQVLKMYKLCLNCHKRQGECKCKTPIFETIFEYGPSPIPTLDEDQWKAVVKQMNKPPTKEEKDRLKRIKEMFKDSPLQVIEMRVLICGDRRWSNIKIIDDYVKSLPKDTVIIEGNCSGADSMAGFIAKKCGLIVEVYPANWDKYGKSAGPIRNREMLNKGKPDLVVAFHDDIDKSKGTKNMVSLAREKRLQIENRTSDGSVYLYDYHNKVFVNITISPTMRKLLDKGFFVPLK